MRFELTQRQLVELAAWIEKQDLAVCVEQGTFEPYYGACGGELTYSFTPCSLGMCVVVTHGLTKEEINLTNYEEW